VSLFSAEPIVEMLEDAGLPSAHSCGNWTAGQAGGLQLRAGGAPLIGAGPSGEMLESAEPPSAPPSETAFSGAQVDLSCG
jgi:hypothetical protein